MGQKKSGKRSWNPLLNLGKTLGLGVLLLNLFSVSQAAFQESLWGARPSGLAGAFTALADDANAPAYNPAGIALLSRSELTFMYAQLYSGVDLYAGEDTSKLGLGYFSFVPRLGDNRFGHFGVSWSNMQATSLYSEDAFCLTYARAVALERDMNSDMIFAYGANIKMLKHQFTLDTPTSNDPVFENGNSADAFTADLGIIVRPNFNVLPGLKMGAAVQNVTEPDLGLAGTDRVPAKYTLGFAYQDRDFKLINPTMDISWRSGDTLWTAGCEGWFARNQFAYRVGGNEDNLAGGLGFQFRLFDGIFMRLDYSMIWPLNVEGTSGSHRISLTTSF